MRNIAHLELDEELEIKLHEKTERKAYFKEKGASLFETHVFISGVVEFIKGIAMRYLSDLMYSISKYRFAGLGGGNPGMLPGLGGAG